MHVLILPHSDGRGCAAGVHAHIGASLGVLREPVAAAEVQPHEAGAVEESASHGADARVDHLRRGEVVRGGKRPCVRRLLERLGHRVVPEDHVLAKREDHPSRQPVGVLRRPGLHLHGRRDDIFNDGDDFFCKTSRNCVSRCLLRCFTFSGKRLLHISKIIVA
eukprot:6208098-Pleurochrysis_carterae.AAC.3